MPSDKPIYSLEELYGTGNYKMPKGVKSSKPVYRMEELEQVSEPKITLTPGKSQYSLLETPIAAMENFLPSLGKNIKDQAIGMATMVTQPVETLESFENLLGGTVLNLLPKSVSEKIGKTIPKEYFNSQKMMDAANAVGGYYGDRYGSYDNIKRSLAEDPVGTGADLAALVSLAIPGLEGMGLSRAAKMASTSERALSLPGRLPFKAAGSGVNAMKFLTDPKGKSYFRATEGRVPEITNALRNAENFVEGYEPTSMEAAVEANSPKFQEFIQQSMRNAPDEVYARKAANKNALIQSIDDIAGTPADMEMALSDRRNFPSRLYGVNDATKIRSDAELESILRTPAGRSALQEAQTIAANKREPFNVGKPKYKSINGEMVLQENTPIYTGKNLSYLKTAGFDPVVNMAEKSIASPMNETMTPGKLNAIKKARLDYMNWFEDKSPAFKEANKQFKELSKPINEMEVGKILKDDLVNTLGQDASELRAGKFVESMKTAPKKAGLGDIDLKKVLSPEKFKKAEAVKKELERTAKAKYMAKDVNKSETPSTVLSNVKAPPLLSVWTSMTNWVASKFDGDISNKIAAKIAFESLEPKQQAKLIEDALSKSERFEGRKAKINKLGNTLNRGKIAPVNRLLQNMVNTKNASGNALIGM